MPQDKITIRLPTPRIQVDKVTPLTGRDDKLWQTQRELEYAWAEIRRLQDRIRRLTEEIQWQIVFWESGLDKREWTIGLQEARRKLSQLRGAISYEGNSRRLTEER